MAKAKTAKAAANPDAGSPKARIAGVCATGAPGAIPAIVWDTLWAHSRTRALETAVAIGIFDQLLDMSRTAGALARATKCSHRGVRMLADTLVALGFMTKTKERYDLTEIARLFLVSSSPASLGGLIGLSASFRRPFDHLTEIVRTGKPAQVGDVEELGQKVFLDLVDALFPSSFGVARLAREALPTRVRSRVKQVLDIAAGSAAWSLAWAFADPEVRVTALDFTEVLGVTRQYTDGFGCTDRYEFLEGNLQSAKLGSSRYDLVILGQICHSEGARGSRRLIEKSVRALKPDGLLLIADMVPNEQRTAPVNHLLFAMNMLVSTWEGDVFTLAEYHEWMQAAGLSSVQKLDVGSEGPDIIVGTKRVGTRFNPKSSRRPA